MISLSAPIYDPSSTLVVHNGSASPKAFGRRAKRVATLDGGAVLVDGGYSPSDLTYLVSIPDTQRTAYAFLSRLISTYPEAVLGCRDGCFLVLLGSLDFKDGLTTVSADVLEGLC